MKISTEELAAGALTPENVAIAVRSFADAGYVVLEDIYDTAFLDTVRTAYDQALAAFLASKGGLEALEGKTFGKNHIGFFPPLFAPLADTRLAAHPIAVQLMRQLLGPDLQCAFFHTNTAMPGSGIQPIHRDCQPLFGTEQSVPHPVTTLVVNIPLCDFTLENGATEVWPGTHLIVDRDASDTQKLEERAALLPSVRTFVTAGSLVIRDMRMWHRGMPNNADYPRTMYAIVYERGFIRTPVISIPRSTWESWSDDARHIFRHNTVIDDADHTPRTWGT